VAYPGAKFVINSSKHGFAKAYTFENLPAGLRKAGADTVQGTPTVSGIVAARVIGWEKANASGNSARFDIQFDIQGAPPVITLQPISQTVDVGANVTFSVAATGEAPLTYQWFREDLEIAGTQPTLTLTGVTAGQAARYRARVNSPAGATFSDFATLTVNTVFPPTITTQPIDVTVIEGGSVAFSVEATGVGPFSFAWTKNGVAVSPGGTGQVLPLNPVRPADAGR
jgi:hypothetical protein